MGTTAGFYFPSGVVVDGTGTVFVADTNDGAIRKITPEAVVTTLAGPSGPAGPLLFPRRLAVDGAGNVFVAERHGNAIRKITPSGMVSTAVGVAGQTVVGNFPGPLPASIAMPAGVVIDSSPRGADYTSSSTMR